MTSVSALRRYVTVAVVGIGLYFLLPTPAQNLAFVVSNLVAAAAIVMRVRSGALQPAGGWLALAAYPVAVGVGNSVYFVNDSLRHVAPFPSLADAALMGASVILAAGLVWLHHESGGGRNFSALLDATIITIGFTAASWVLFISPVLHDPGIPLLERLAALGYPVGRILILAVAARYFLSTGLRSPAHRWLAGIVIAMLVSGSIFGSLNILGIYHTGHWLDAVMLGYNLAWGAVALHPNANELTAVASHRTGRPSWTRLALLTTASMIAPAVIIVQVATGHLRDVVVTTVAAAVLFGLVVVRMAGLVRQLEKVLEQRHALQDELAYRATHDELTGLANRRNLTDQLTRALHQHPEGGTTVLFLDLDRFKAVNDNLGHGAGDALLTIVANRLRNQLRADDTLARFGGDEFAVLLGDPTPSPVQLKSLIDRMVRVVQLPVRIHGIDVQVGVSIGTATAKPGDAVEHLLQAADHAMYAIKATTQSRPQQIVAGLPRPSTSGDTPPCGCSRGRWPAPSVEPRLVQIRPR